MLAFHVLNVGHGSSVVVEYETDAGRSFGVIDSNAHSGQTPRALIKLKQLGATQLSFVALTHPHKDHFSGLYEVISSFQGAIDQFYSCPFGNLLQNRDRLRSLGRGLQRILARSDGLDERRAALEMAQILAWAERAVNVRALDWHECKGEDFSIAPPRFANVEISTVLPPSRVISDYVSRIAKGDMSVLGRFNDNEISLAFKFLYRGKCVILGGDGTLSNWQTRQRYERNSTKKLSGDAVNLPHHGSKYDCTPQVLSQLFYTAPRRFGVSSADGASHPDIEVIEWLEDNSIEPFCTNLIAECGANAQRLLILPGVEPQMARWIREVASTNEIQACQGDIVVKIDDSGLMTVTPEHNHPCAYRGDYDRLFGVH